MDKNTIFALMKRIIAMAVALMALSCSKDSPYNISPVDLLNNPSMVANTTITTKNGDFEKTVAPFRSFAVYKKSEYERQSHFCAMSGGKMVYEAFMLSFYFDDIEKMKVGDTLKTRRFTFSFFLSSDSRATTDTYEGKIKLAAKGDDYVILHFDKVLCSCSFGDYLIDGYLNCPLFEEYGAEE